MTNKKWLDRLVIAALIGLVVLFLGRALLPGRVLLPLDIVVQFWPPWQQPDTVVSLDNSLISDVVNYIYPVKSFVAEQVKQGTVPLWNPYVLAGYPLTYNVQAGLWYPLSILYYLLPATTAVDLTVFLQMALGGLFMFAYLRQLKLRRLAALLGAVVFLFNGMMVVWMEWQVIHAAVIWLPLCLFFLERLWQRIEQAERATSLNAALTRDAIFAGIAFALPWLGGHWNWALYSSLTALVYGLFRIGEYILRSRRSERGEAEKVTVNIGLLLKVNGLGLMVGIGLSLIQVIPSFLYLSQGNRQPLSFADSLSEGLIDQAIVALLPNFFGNPTTSDYWGPFNYNEASFYLGIFTLLLIFLAPLLRRDRITGFYSLWGGVGLLWALGTPLYGLLWILPVFKGLMPSRAITVVVFCGTVLAAMGMDSLLKLPFNSKVVRRTSFMLLGVMAAMVIIYVVVYQPGWLKLRAGLLWLGVMVVVAGVLLWGFGRGWLGRRLFAFLVLLTVVCDLFWVGYDYNTVGNVADLYPETETARFLRADPETYRIATLPEGVAYPPNTGLNDRIQTISGYEPAVMQNWINYITAAEGKEALHVDRVLMPLVGVSSPLLDAVNVKYVVTINDWYQLDSTPGPAQEPVDAWEVLSDTGVTQLFVMPDAGLHRIEFPLDIGEEASGEVVARVFAPDGIHEFANSAWEVNGPPEDGWASFYYGPFASEWGREFLLVVSFSGEGEVQIGKSSSGLAFRTYYHPRPQLVHEAGKTRVYVNEGYQPRAYLVSEAVTARDVDDALEKVLANQERLDEVVVLETDSLPQEYVPGDPGSAVITAYTPNRVTIAAEMNAPGYLVLADTYYPGWQATVDGEATPIYRANSVVRAIQLPAGEHQIEFLFRPLDFIVGASISLATLFLALLLLSFMVFHNAWRVRR